MARKDNTQALKDVIEELMKKQEIGEQFNEQKLMAAWPTVLGEGVARQTIEMKIKNRVLFVRLSSPALKEELSFAKTKLIESLNLSAGSKVIDNIVFG